MKSASSNDFLTTKTGMLLNCLITSVSFRPNGTHSVLVHNVVGSLLELSHTAVGKNQAKELCRQITTGLGFLHRNVSRMEVNHALEYVAVA
jgi:hypothetical protein